MNIAEMKQEAIDGIGKINDEAALKEILAHIAQLCSLENKQTINLAQYYDEAKNQYGEVLTKLAQ